MNVYILHVYILKSGGNILYYLDLYILCLSFEKGEDKVTHARDKLLSLKNTIAISKLSVKVQTIFQWDSKERCLLQNRVSIISMNIFQDSSRLFLYNIMLLSEVISQCVGQYDIQINVQEISDVCVYMMIIAIIRITNTICNTRISFIFYKYLKCANYSLHRFTSDLMYSGTTSRVNC